MKSFHFDFGNSDTGAVGMCARVLANSTDEAVKILRDKIESLDLAGGRGVAVVDDNDPGSPEDTEPHIEYLVVYMNHKNVDAEQIDDVEDRDEVEEPEDEVTAADYSPIMDDPS